MINTAAGSLGFYREYNHELTECVQSGAYLMTLVLYWKNNTGPP